MKLFKFNKFQMFLVDLKTSRGGISNVEQEDFIYIREIMKNMKYNEDDQAQTMMADNVIETSADKEVAFRFVSQLSSYAMVLGKNFQLGD